MQTTNATVRTITAEAAAATQRPTGSAPARLALRHGILDALQGPEYRTVPEIPRAWSVPNADVAGAVRALWEEGLVERAADPRSAGALPAYRATAAGRQELHRSAER
jgi:hypothetical protein